MSWLRYPRHHHPQATRWLGWLPRPLRRSCHRFSPRQCTEVMLQILIVWLWLRDSAKPSEGFRLHWTRRNCHPCLDWDIIHLSLNRCPLLHLEMDPLVLPSPSTLSFNPIVVRGVTKAPLPRPYLPRVTPGVTRTFGHQDQLYHQ